MEPAACVPSSDDDEFEPGVEVASPVVDPGYLRAEIRPKMRSVLFDWMQQVGAEIHRFAALTTVMALTSLRLLKSFEEMFRLLIIYICFIMTFSILLNI
jgi:hypothetical protein